MKINTIVLFLFLINTSGFSQTSNFIYQGRRTPSIKKEKLNKAISIGEMMPAFSQNFVVPYQERTMLNQQLDQRSILDVYVLQDNKRKSDYTLENYSSFLDYVSIKISATCDGKFSVSESKNEILTWEQKNIINNVDPGTDITVKIKFKYKNKSINSAKIIEGEYVVTAVPQTEAEYPGGFKQISEYYNKNVMNQITGKKTAEKILNATVKFTINEQGQIVDAQIFRTSTDPKIDQLLLQATNKMPKWKPAENSNGLKVKQQFIIPFGGEGC